MATALSAEERARRLMAQATALRLEQRGLACLRETLGSAATEQRSSDQRELAACVETIARAMHEFMETEVRLVQARARKLQRVVVELQDEKRKTRAVDETIARMDKARLCALHRRAQLEAVHGIARDPAEKAPRLPSVLVAFPRFADELLYNLPCEYYATDLRHEIIEAFLDAVDLEDVSQFDAATRSFVERFIVMAQDYRHLLFQTALVAVMEDSCSFTYEKALVRTRLVRQGKERFVRLYEPCVRAAVEALQATEAAIATAGGSASLALVPQCVATNTRDQTQPAALVVCAAPCATNASRMKMVETLSDAKRVVDTIMQRLVQVGTWRPKCVDSTGELLVAVPQTNHQSQGRLVTVVFPSSFLKKVLCTERDAAAAVLTQCRSVLETQTEADQEYFSTGLEMLSMSVERITECVDKVAAYMTHEISLFESVYRDGEAAAPPPSVSDLLVLHESRHAVWQEPAGSSVAAADAADANTDVWSPQPTQTWIRARTKAALTQHAASEFIIRVLGTMVAATRVGHKDAHEGLEFVSRLLSATTRACELTVYDVTLMMMIARKTTMPPQLASAIARVSSLKEQLVASVESWTKVVDVLRDRGVVPSDAVDDVEDAAVCSVSEGRHVASSCATTDSSIPEDRAARRLTETSVEAPIKTKRDQGAQATVRPARQVIVANTQVSPVERLRELVEKCSRLLSELGVAVKKPGVEFASESMRFHDAAVPVAA